MIGAETASILGRFRPIAIALGVLAAIALPFMLADYITFRFTLALIWSVAIVGMVILSGVSGQISVGHSAFYGIGGYAAAIMLNEAGVSVYWGLPAALLTCFAVGYGFGRVATKFSLWYLALASYGLAVAFPQLLRWHVIERFTGGVQGFFLDLQGAPDWSGLSADRWWYLVALACLLAGMKFAHNLIDSRTGRAIKAARDNELSAAAQGIDVPHYRALAFAISAAYVGLAGCLAAIQLNFVAPGTYTFWLSMQFLIGLVIGGMHSVGGAVIGGLFVQFFPDLTADIGKRLSMPLFGVLLVLAVVSMPRGIVGGVTDMALRLKSRWRGQTRAS
jgi:branched-chain amino acid transport system permease protein